MSHLRAAASVVSAAAVAVGSTVLAAPAFAESTAAENYAALGDSYASGVGTREYIDEDCLRSEKGYPKLWSDAHEVANFEFVACSGATTDDLNANQLGALNEDTTIVTVSIGGNDIGFSDIVQDCLLGTDSGCDDAVSEGEAKARDELPGKLDTTYSNIASAAPNAEVVVVGYPRLTELGDCDIPAFSDAKRERLNEGADVLASVIEERASAAGFKYADPRSAFDGHGVCSSDEWVNGPSNPLVESFHPNADGYANGYLPTLTDITG